MRSLLLLVAACNADAAAPTTPSQPADGFVYTEGNETLFYNPPVGIRYVHDGQRCDSELSTGKDNMWTAPDVQDALADPDVQAIVARGGKMPFVPTPEFDNTIHVGSIRIGKATIEWTMACRWCIAEPPGVKRLHMIAAGILANRRAVCKI